MKKQLKLEGFSTPTSNRTHGGDQKNPQKTKRPLALRSRNHFVLRSTHAKGAWSFRRHRFEIAQILRHFARKHSIGLTSYANVGNHIHLSLEISTRRQYQKFIRAISAAIMMRVTGFSRWNKAPQDFHFWDQRPFSRALTSWKEAVTLDRYFELNRWEAAGVARSEARLWLNLMWAYQGP
jgi:hypothetical protein